MLTWQNVTYFFQWKQSRLLVSSHFFENDTHARKGKKRTCIYGITIRTRGIGFLKDLHMAQEKSYKTIGLYLNIWNLPRSMKSRRLLDTLEEINHFTVIFFWEKNWTITGPFCIEVTLGNLHFFSNEFSIGSKHGNCQ